MLVDPEEAGGYFAALSDYIHLNPVRVRLVRLEDRLVDYCWSSYRAYVTDRERAGWLEVGRVSGEMGEYGGGASPHMILLERCWTVL